MLRSGPAPPVEFCRKSIEARLPHRAVAHHPFVQFAERLRPERVEPPPAPARLPSLADHIEGASLAVDREVKAGDDAIAVQERHHEVTPALAFRYIDLQFEVEIP